MYFLVQDLSNSLQSPVMYTPKVPKGSDWFQAYRLYEENTFLLLKSFVWISVIFWLLEESQTAMNLGNSELPFQIIYP